MTMQPRRLSGRCSNGYERGQGMRWHAVPEAEVPFGKALCGAKPGRLSGVGWREVVGSAVTCPRCLAKIARRERLARPHLTLTKAQRTWLERLGAQDTYSRERTAMGDRAGPEVTQPYGDNFRTFERVIAALIEKGLAERYVHGGWVITDAGRAWLAEAST